jgi:hypothetical protein
MLFSAFLPWSFQFVMLPFVLLVLPALNVQLPRSRPPETQS